MTPSGLEVTAFPRDSGKRVSALPIIHALLKPPGVLHTALVGRVTDDELLAYYLQPFMRELPFPWREIVDGTAITDMAITPAGQARLQAFVTASAALLGDARVAMVAASEVTYGMFRMWELQRQGLGYEVEVFRDVQAAMGWIMRG